LRESINSTSTLGGRYEGINNHEILQDRTNMIVNPKIDQLAAKVIKPVSKQNKMLDELIGQSATIGARKDSYLSKPAHMLPNSLNVRSTGSSFA